MFHRSHLRHLQQAQTGLLRGPAGPGHDWRCQHPVEGGPRVAEEARHVNTMSTFLNITKATIKIFPGFFPSQFCAVFLDFFRGFLRNNFDWIYRWQLFWVDGSTNIRTSAIRALQGWRETNGPATLEPTWHHLHTCKTTRFILSNQQCKLPSTRNSWIKTKKKTNLLFGWYMPTILELSGGCLACTLSPLLFIVNVNIYQESTG